MGKDVQQQHPDLREGLTPIAVMPLHSPLVGGHPIFSVHEDLHGTAPGPHLPSGELTHE